MSKIFDAADHAVATIDEEGHVYTMEGHAIGRVGEDEHVYNTNGNIVGSFDGRGQVYHEGRLIGTVRGNRVFDAHDHYVGKVEGPHGETGGAALLVLVR